MNTRKIGRNEPCPCGSGKKYKKCCYGKKMSDKSAKIIHHTLPPHDKINYGNPAINEAFFQTNTIHKLSSPRFIYSILLTPELEKEISNITNQFLDRGKKEATLIENAEDASELVNIMRKGPDSLNRVKLKNKLLEHPKVAIPLIMQALKETQCDAFIELAVEVMHATRENFSNEVLEIIEHYQRDAYAVSLLCMLLGFYENEKSEKLLWDYYHYFKECFLNEAYSDGPLLGLEEMRARRKDKLLGTYSN